ncbi:MAG TPA: hypothetical protein VK917_05190 [Ilumatobacter sp.]|nr:hypothetical protein [Ilumatobacter sp.]
MTAEHATVLGSLPNAGQVIAAGARRGVELLTTVDDFVRHQSKFDRHARLNLSFDVTDVTREMYLDYVASQVLDWTDAELAQLTEIVSDMSKVLQRFQFDLPSPIYLVKTTGQEEAHAAYTRNLDTIVLPANMVASLWVPADFGDPLHEGGSQTYLREVVLHECFHLFSKSNVARRTELYEVIGYRMTDEIELPDVPWPDSDSSTSMRDLKITNPDTPLIDVVIELVIPGGDRGPTPVAPVLLASGPYQGGSFFGLLGWYFMEVVERDGAWTPQLDAGERPVLHVVEPGSELLAVYEQAIGHNLTDELFHPDEVLAQNWDLVAAEPSLELLAKMADLLR